MTNYITYLSHYSDALLSQVQSFGEPKRLLYRGLVVCLWKATVLFNGALSTLKRSRPTWTTAQTVRRYNYLLKNVTKVIASVRLLRASSRSIIVLSASLGTAISIYLVLDFFLKSRLFSFSPVLRLSVSLNGKFLESCPARIKDLSDRELGFFRYLRFQFSLRF